MSGKFKVIPSITDTLSKPEQGKRQLKGHDKGFDDIDAGWDATRDGINSAIDSINGLLAKVTSFQLPRLTEKSLEQLIVLPLSGDYYAIGANANACTVMHDGLFKWGQNFSIVSADAPLAFRGDAAAAFLLGLNAFRLVVDAIGEVFNAGKGVFNDVARVSEAIAIRVAKIERVLIEKLLKLLGKLVSKFTSWIGWIEFAGEIATKGKAAVTDIWNDIKDVVTAIEDAFKLVDTVKTWAQTAADRLKTFEDIVDLAKNLPKMTPDQALKNLHVDPALQKVLDEIFKEFPPVDKDAEGDLNREVNRQTGQVDPWYAQHCIIPSNDPTPWDAHNGDGPDAPPGSPSTPPGWHPPMALPNKNQPPLPSLSPSTTGGT